MVDLAALLGNIDYITLGYALGMIIGSIIAAKIVFIAVHRIMAKAAARTKTDLDDRLLAALEKPVYFGIIVMGAYYGLDMLVPAEYAAYLAYGMMGAATIIGIWLATSISKIVIRHTLGRFAEKSESKMDDDLVLLLVRVSRIMIIFIGAIILLGQVGIEITPLLASLGVAGLAIALALQDTLANFFSGIQLTFDKSFHVGDVVTIEKGGHTGVIEEFGSRSTRIRTFDDTVVTIPNAELAKTSIVNHSAPGPIVRVKIPVGVAYGSDIDRVKEIMEGVAKNCRSVVPDPAPVARFMKFGDSALEFKMYAWTDLDNKLGTVHELNAGIAKAFEENNIEIPFPTRTIYTKSS